MGYTERLSEQLAFIAMAASATAAAGSTLVTEAIPLGNGRRTLFTLTQNAAAGSSQIFVQGATASGATFATITSLTSGLLSGSGGVQSEATSENVVSLNLNYSWLRGVINVTAGNVSGVCLQVYQDAERYGPASQYNRTYVLAATIF